MSMQNKSECYLDIYLSNNQRMRLGQLNGATVTMTFGTTENSENFKFNIVDKHGNVTGYEADRGNLTVAHPTVQILPNINNADPPNLVETPAPIEATPAQIVGVPLPLPEENRRQQVLVKQELVEIVAPQVEEEPEDVGVPIVEQQGLRNIGRPVELENRQGIEEVNLVRIKQEPRENLDAPPIGEPELEQVAPLVEAQVVQQPVEPVEEEDRDAPEVSPQPVVVNKRKRRKSHRWTHLKKGKRSY